MITRLRHRLATRRAAQADRAQSQLIDQILADQRTESGQRFYEDALHYFSGPSPTIYDETVQAHGSDPLAGVKVRRISRIIGNVHGYALAAPLRGAR